MGSKERSMTDFVKIADIATEIVRLLEEKGRFYGDSWRKRGGPGAFMVMARKWDRIENICGPQGYDIFKALDADSGGVRDDIQDLIGYLLLILEATRRGSIADNLVPHKVTSSESTVEGYTIEGYYGDGTLLYKCKTCKKEIRANSETLVHTCTPS
jgi:hypothetical protein